jgi:hypothetical protein
MVKVKEEHHSTVQEGMAYKQQAHKLEVELEGAREHCTGSCKSSYHMSRITTAPGFEEDFNYHLKICIIWLNTAYFSLYFVYLKK